MAIVFLLERLVMTVLEGRITNDQFLACTSVGALRPFGIGQHFLFFRLVRDVQTLGNWPSAQGKVKTKKTRHVMIRQLILLSFS